jgi:hypothetical protein
MLNASYTIPTASNNKVVSMTNNCLIVRFIGHHPVGEKPPPTRRTAADGGNPWRYGAPTSYHGLTHANPMPRKSPHRPTLRRPMGARMVAYPAALGGKEVLPSINLPQMNGLPNKKERPPATAALSCWGLKPMAGPLKPCRGAPRSR